MPDFVSDFNVLSECVPQFDLIIENDVLCGTIRNVGGWAVHKCRQQCIKNIHTKGKTNHSYLSACHQLNSFTCNSGDVNTSTKYPSSLHHVNRINRGGLVHISDSMFEFFCCVESVPQQLYTEDNLHFFRKDVTRVLEDAMHSNFYLQQMFSSLLKDIPPIVNSDIVCSSDTDDVFNLSVLFPDSVSLGQSDSLSPDEAEESIPFLHSEHTPLFLYHLIISRYVHMRQKEFLRRMGSELNPKKAIALRKELTAVSHCAVPPTQRKRFVFKPWMVDILVSDLAAGRDRDNVIILERASKFECQVSSIKGWFQRRRGKNKASTAASKEP